MATSLMNCVKWRTSRLVGDSVLPLFITDRRPYSTIHRRGPSLSGCHCSYLEQFTSARHFCTFIACLPVTPQDSSLHHFLSQPVTMYSARAVTLVISDTNPSCYLLTYLLTYLPMLLLFLLLLLLGFLLLSC